jgi:hypothetical protein
MVEQEHKMSTEAILGFGITFVVFILFIGLVIHEYRSIGKRSLPNKTSEKEPPVE